MTQASGSSEGTPKAGIVSVDPRTGMTVGTVARETTPDQLEERCRAAAAAAPALDEGGRFWRAELLREMAAALEERRDEIVTVADRETALGEGRLNSELTRTCYQFQLFADALEEGAYLEVVVDHAADTPMGPRPDVRRMLVPRGPVAVFGASNFPLAFSVPGGDTVSALAAGCPVLVKAHPSHPETSELCGAVLAEAAGRAGAPEGTIALVHGQQVGADLVRHPLVRAVGFTGSLAGGRALFDIAAGRADPIPFYGELGSVNPLVVTPEAAAHRGSEIASGLVGSVTLGDGQFCTKPGLVFLPEHGGGPAMLNALVDEVSGREPGTLLNEAVRDGYLTASTNLAAADEVRLLAEGAPARDRGWSAPVRLLATRAADLGEHTVTECFGPATLVVTYTGQEELLDALRRVPGSLTTSLFAESTERDLASAVAAVAGERAGRLVFDGYPTGVAVAWAMQHGGPWPATTDAGHTSVGVTAIRRFLRPMTWQNAPEYLLADELRDVPASPVPRRVDGELVLS